MTHDDEKKWVHPKLLPILKDVYTDEYMKCPKCETEFEVDPGAKHPNGVLCPECRRRGYMVVGVCHIERFGTITEQEWNDAGRPILTDEAKAVLEAGTIAAFIEKQSVWSEKTFGPGPRTEGVLRHIEKEIMEVRENPSLEEWVDIILLAMDGARRCCGSPRVVADALERKRQECEKRKWSAIGSQDEPIEHIRRAVKGEKP